MLIHSVYNSLHLLTPTSHPILPPAASPLIARYFIYFPFLFWDVLGLCCCEWIFSSFSAPVSRGTSLVVMPRILLLQSVGSRASGLSSCGTWTQLPHSMWDIPRAGIQPVSPAFSGRFLTTGLPAKSCQI